MSTTHSSAAQSSTAHALAAQAPAAHAPVAPVPGTGSAGLERAVLPPVIGTAVERVDAVEKVTGTAVYVGDVRVSRMLHAAVVRSPHANARVLSVDTSRAERLPGVHAVITGADTARVKWGAFRPDLYPLAIERVRYVGDEVAAVAAVDLETAPVRGRTHPRRVRGAARGPQPGRRARRRRAAGPRRRAGQPRPRFSYDRGGADDWFERSDVVVEGMWQSARQWHGSIETIGCAAQ